LVSFDGAPGLVGIGFSGCYSSGIRKITPKNDDISKAYLYFLMKSPEVQEVIDRYSEGTTIKHASKSISHIIAPYVAGSERDLLLSTAFEQLINNIKEIDNLTTLRDTLLPRLISGKLKV
jgi:type I restriction enzyme S subunit